MAEELNKATINELFRDTKPGVYAVRYRPEGEPEPHYTFWDRRGAVINLPTGIAEHDGQRFSGFAFEGPISFADEAELAGLFPDVEILDANALLGAPKSANCE